MSVFSTHCISGVFSINRFCAYKSKSWTCLTTFLGLLFSVRYAKCTFLPVTFPHSALIYIISFYLLIIKNQVSLFLSLFNKVKCSKLSVIYFHHCRVVPLLLQMGWFRSNYLLESILSTFYKQFFQMKVFCAAFLCLEFGLVFFYKSYSHRMLVKLSIGWLKTLNAAIMLVQ